MLDDDFEEKVEAYLAAHPARRECDDTVWKTMDSAPTDPGIEVIAARFVRYDELTSMCEKSPFISFWLQTRRKFYGEPTHWLCRVPSSFPSVHT